MSLEKSKEIEEKRIEEQKNKTEAQLLKMQRELVLRINKGILFVEHCKTKICFAGYREAIYEYVGFGQSSVSGSSFGLTVVSCDKVRAFLINKCNKAIKGGAR